MDKVIAIIAIAAAFTFLFMAYCLYEGDVKKAAKALLVFVVELIAAAALNWGIPILTGENRPENDENSAQKNEEDPVVVEDPVADISPAPLGDTELYKGESYIFVNSDTQKLAKEDLNGLSEWEIRIARDEIFARHGRRFEDHKLQEYFDSCPWYSGTIEPHEFDYTTMLNDVEKDNIETIKQFEKEHGYNYTVP